MNFGLGQNPYILKCFLLLIIVITNELMRKDFRDKENPLLLFWKI